MHAASDSANARGVPEPSPAPEARHKLAQCVRVCVATEVFGLIFSSVGAQTGFSVLRFFLTPELPAFGYSILPRSLR